MDLDTMTSLNKAITSLTNVRLDLDRAMTDSIIDSHDGSVAKGTVVEASAAIGNVILQLRKVQNASMAAQREWRSRPTTSASGDSIATAAATLPIRPFSTTVPSTASATNNPTVSASQPNPSDSPTPSTLPTQQTAESIHPTAPSTRLSARKTLTYEHERRLRMEHEHRCFIHLDCAQNCNPSEGMHVWTHRLSGDRCIVHEKPVLCAGCKAKGKPTDG